MEACVWRIELPGGEWEACGEPAVDYVINYRRHPLADDKGRLWYCAAHYDRFDIRSF
jgi:hypothetical protein